MEHARIGNSALDKTHKTNQESQNHKHIIESQLQRADDLTALGPQAPGQVDGVHGSGHDDNAIRPQDSFERQPPKPVAAPLVKGPEVGARIAQAAEDVAIPVDGRGAAVALHEHLQQLHHAGQDDRFAATAKALGVNDVKAFKAAFERGDHALGTFSQVDSSRLRFVDGDFNEVDADLVSAVAKPQLLIKPSFAAPVDPAVEHPEVNFLDPNRRQHYRQDHPADINELLQKRQTEPALATPKPGDQTADVQA